MKKVLIVYATYGSGHKAIAKYIKNYFSNQNEKLDIKLIDMLDYSKKTGKMSKNISEKLMFHFPLIWNILFKWSDHKHSSHLTNKLSLNWFEKEKLGDEIVDFNPDLIISTHFYASCFTSDLKSAKKINSEIITIITDYEVHNVWLDHYKGNEYIVVPSKEEKKCLAKNISKKNIKTFGIPIFPKEDDLNKKNQILEKLGFNTKKLTCVCFSGGGDGSTTTMPFIKALLKSNQDLNYIFVAGNNKRAYNKIDSLVKKYNVSNVKVYGFVNNVPELLIASDFVITKPGGAQSTECLYFKKPMLLIKGISGQESYNASYFTKLKYARMFKRPSKLYKYLKSLDKNILDINNMHNNLVKADSTSSMKKLYKFAMELLK